MKPFIEIGNVYKRRDGRLAFVYMFNPVSNTFECIVQNSGQVYTVSEDGKYYMTQDSHNDLVELVK